jgi:membrane-associated phospholipid phosphatase
MRNKVPVFISAFVGVFMILKYFLTSPVVKSVADELEQWGVVTLSFAIVLGVLNLIKINLKAVMERKTDWGYKLLLLVSMFTMMIAGGVKWYLEEVQGRATNNGLPVALHGTLFDFLFDHVYFPLSATIFALLAFYVASAAFRAFRAKNFLATLLLVAAVIVMIGRVPVGGAIWKGFPWLQEWIMTWPNTAGQRAIQIGAAIGMIATGLRVIFGIEKPYLKG